MYARWGPGRLFFAVAILLATSISRANELPEVSVIFTSRCKSIRELSAPGVGFELSMDYAAGAVFSSDWTDTVQVDGSEEYKQAMINFHSSREHAKSVPLEGRTPALRQLKNVLLATKQAMENKLGHPVQEVMLAVPQPDYFNESAIQYLLNETHLTHMRPYLMARSGMARLAFDIAGCRYNGLASPCELEDFNTGFLVIEYDERLLCLKRGYFDDTFPTEDIVKCHASLGFQNKIEDDHISEFEKAIRAILLEQSEFEGGIDNVIILGKHSFDPRIRKLLRNMFGTKTRVLPEEETSSMHVFSAVKGAALRARRAISYQNSDAPPEWHCPSVPFVEHPDEIQSGDSRRDDL